MVEAGGGSDSNVLVLEHGEQRREEEPSSPSQPRGNHFSKVLYTLTLHSESRLQTEILCIYIHRYIYIYIVILQCRLLRIFVRSWMGLSPAGSKPPEFVFPLFPFFCQIVDVAEARALSRLRSSLARMEGTWGGRGRGSWRGRGRGRGRGKGRGRGSVRQCLDVFFSFIFFLQGGI
jgi:hypothetical protein